MIRLLRVLFLFSVVSHLSVSQVRAPKREVRAAWITTVNSLDWPRSTDPVEQRRTLSEIVEKLRSANFNTIFFQVRGRADAMYRSQYEPWSLQLTGTLGKDPGWDPLQYLVTEAHARGMEIHAWFNTFLIKTSPGRSPESRPRHVTLEHPEWVQNIDGEWWIDPGVPNVREYTLAVAMDIVRNYDVDGMHFDFIRYPVKLFPDDASYRRYGNGMSKADWRRENINTFVRMFYDSTVVFKPMLKIGSAPIGIYDRAIFRNTLHSYEDVYQDSRRWLKERWMDYLVPQVYWSLGSKPGNPDFADVVKEWSENTFDRHVYIGIGAYKQEVNDQLPLLIDSIRSYQMPGEAFFRYENISDELQLGRRYAYPANIPPMLWKDSIPPNPPLQLVVQNTTDDIFELRWKPPLPATDGDGAKFFNVYRSSSQPVQVEDPANLLAIIGSDRESFIDTIRYPTSVKYYYAVTALDDGYNESSLPKEESVVIPEIVQLARRFDARLSLFPPYQLQRSDAVFIPYELEYPSLVDLSIVSTSGIEMVNLVHISQALGRHIIGTNTSALKEGVYVIRLSVGNDRIEKTFKVGR